MNKQLEQVNLVPQWKRQRDAVQVFYKDKPQDYARDMSKLQYDILVCRNRHEGFGTQKAVLHMANTPEYKSQPTKALRLYAAAWEMELGTDFTKTT